MAITGRPTAEAAGLRSARRHELTAAAAASALLLCPAAAHAARWALDAGVSSTLTWSSNGDLGIGTESRADTLLEVRPHLSLTAEGPRLRLRGNLALDGVATVHDTQPKRILPEADVNAHWVAIERFLFVDAGVHAQRTSQNPFGVRPELATSANTLTTAQAHLSPFIESSIDASTRYRLRSENSWTHDIGPAASQASVTAAAGYFGRHSLALEHDPRPLGWRLEAERSQTRYRDDAQQPITADIARLVLDYALGADTTAGVRAGREHTDLVTRDTRRNIYGWQAQWRPSERTTLAAFDEQRFFGSAWRLSFDHRMPRLAWSIVASRSLDTTPQALFNLLPTDNVAALIDAMFTTRYPDPIARAEVVQDFLAQQGIASGTLRPTTIYSPRLSIVTLRSATVTLTGTRNTLALSAFLSRTEDAPDAGNLATGTALTNNSEQGASATLSHRLSPTTNVNMSIDASRIRALQAPDRTTQHSARLQLNTELSPRTTLVGGVRYRKLRSNVTPEGREGAVFVGLDYRF